MEKIYVLYHGGGCLDGLGSKFAAWKKFGDAATYIPVQYGNPLPEIEEGSHVHVVDFSYPRDVLEALRARVNTLVVLDHHKTAEEALRGFPGAIFDMNKSGAVLTWEYMHPGVPVPKLLLHVQDRDLWQFKLEDTPAVTAALPLLRGEMPQWDRCACDEKNLHLDLVVPGKLILAYSKLQVENALKDVVVLPFKGHKAGVRNYTGNASDLGDAICKSEELGVNFSLTYFINTDGDVIFSFRSKGDIDVSDLAEGMNGGGHRGAAGSRLPRDEGLEFLRELYDGRK